MGEWTVNYIEYDQELPDGGRAAVDAYYATRQPPGVRVHTVTNADDWSSVNCIYGDPGCPSSTGNGGLSMIMYVTPGSDATCTTAAAVIQTLPEAPASSGSRRPSDRRSRLAKPEAQAVALEPGLC